MSRSVSRPPVGPRSSMGAELLNGLTAYADALEAGVESEQFTIRSIRAELVPRAYSPDRVRDTRRLMNMSQAVFAMFLGVSRSTVSQWEQGDRKPVPLACRLMDEIRADPNHWRRRADALFGGE
jgi:DNA-binding transcriptional regulator YiaG